MSRSFGVPLYSDRSRSMTIASDPGPHFVDSPELIEGVKTMSDQIASYRAGGLKMGSRELKDSHFDEDDVDIIDPSSEFGSDRFEKAEAIAGLVSERMAKKRKQKLEQAEV